uniref:Uncharacterized protein n=1 Tax=Plectus sambesii TaxID=2011161 RepID=A0A914XNP0_9BILA
MACLTLLFNNVLICPTFFVQSKGATHAILIGINLFPPLNLTITDRVTQQPIVFNHMRPLPQTNKEASKTVHINRVYLNGRYFVPPGQVRVIRAKLNSVWPSHDSGIFDPLESLAGNKQSHHAVSLETAVVRPETKQFPSRCKTSAWKECG